VLPPLHVPDVVEPNGGGRDDAAVMTNEVLEQPV
jgi:hypothetical protein